MPNSIPKEEVATGVVVVGRILALRVGTDVRHREHLAHAGLVVGTDLATADLVVVGPEEAQALEAILAETEAALLVLSDVPEVAERFAELARVTIGPEAWLARGAEGALRAAIRRRLGDDEEQRDLYRRRRDEAHFGGADPFGMLAAFFDDSADGVVVLGADDAILFCNPAAARLLGARRDEVSGSSFVRLLDDDEAQARFRRQRDATSAVRRAHVDLGMRTFDDRRAVFSASFSRPHGLDPEMALVTMSDVTEERALARELNRTKEFLQRVIDSSVDAIVSADLEGNILLFNPAAERTYGFPADEVVGRRNVADLYPPGVARDVMQRIRSPAHGGVGVLEGFETALRGRNGERIPVMLSAALIVHRGQVTGSVGVFRDLRHRLAMEARLAEAQHELAEREQRAFIAELAGATAHELNQPLTAVMGYASLVQRQVEGDERVDHALAAILGEAERMAEIVRKIGRLTKHASKDYIGHTKIVDIEASVDSDPSPKLEGES